MTVPEKSISCVFVYGTLKRGQLREDRWPHAAKRVTRATTLGALYDLGAYPAMLSGGDVVVGELWCFEEQQMPETLRVLDEIEDYYGEPTDLYQRVIIECKSLDGQRNLAYTYRYAAAPDESMRVDPGPDGQVRWPSD